MYFHDKIVIVTGASSGIGAAIAIKFAQQHAKVVIVARTEAKLKDVATKCRLNGSDPLIIVADVTNDNDVKNVINKTVAQYGKIDVLINNAGMASTVNNWDEKTMETFDLLMATNLRSAVLLSTLAVPHLIEAKGNIINISSVAAMSVFSNIHFAYFTSKAGLDHFTRCLALDLGPKGVRVNSVNPGPVVTDIFNYLNMDENQLKEFMKKMSDSTILGRVSAPEEIGDLVLFLASDKAKAITGTSVVSDNGVLLKRTTI